MSLLNKDLHVELYSKIIKIFTFYLSPPKQVELIYVKTLLDDKVVLAPLIDSEHTDSEHENKSKAHDPHYNKIMTEDFLSTRKHDFEWLVRKCITYGTSINCGIFETTVDRNKFLMWAGYCGKNYLEKRSFREGNCKRAVIRISLVESD